MGKAVYVLDEMPESCLKCYFSEDFDDEEQMESKVVCTLPMMDGRDLSKFTSERASWCPLKELPEPGKNCHAADGDIESQPVEYKLVSKYMAGFDDGWNACLDEICGKDE